MSDAAALPSPTPAPVSRGARTAILAFFVALSVVHGLASWWTPVWGDDWGDWTWAARHESYSPLRWLGAFLWGHPSTSEILGYVTARSDVFRVIVSPAMTCALIVGVFALALRRLPRATWLDALGLAWVSALFWLAGSRMGFVFFHREFAAVGIYSTALAVWWLLPLWCGWRIPRRLELAMIVGAVLVGLTTRQLAVGALVALVTLPAARRPLRYRALRNALAIGTLAGFALPPWLEVARIVTHGFEPDLLLLATALRPGSLVIAALVVGGVAARWRWPQADGGALGDSPDPSEALRWLAAAVAISAFALFGPRYSDATLVPATAALAAGALPYVLWLAQVRTLRTALVALVALVHLLAWWLALDRYHTLGDAWRERVAILAHAPTGATPVIPPYEHVMPDFWEFGEDLSGAASRQAVAIDVFDLADIDIDPRPRRFEPNPEVRVQLEVGGMSDAELAPYRPHRWATEPAVARVQFSDMFTRIESDTGMRPTARLVVTSIALGDFAKGRKLVVAWADRNGIFAPVIRPPHVDNNERYETTIIDRYADTFDEAYAVHDGIVSSTPYIDGSAFMRPKTKQLAAMVLCNRDYCLVANAFLPPF